MRAEYGQGLMSAPDDDGGPQFKWLHVRSGDQVFILLSDKLPLWYRAHWWEGRMQPCQGEECRLCDAGVGKQRRWIFAVATANDLKPYLWEVSESLAQEIRVIIEKNGEQKNVHLRIYREGTGPKGRLSVSDRGKDQYHRVDGLVFPEPQEALELTWAVLERPGRVLAESKSGEAAQSERRALAEREY